MISSLTQPKPILSERQRGQVLSFATHSETAMVGKRQDLTPSLADSPFTLEQTLDDGFWPE
jgi:hypothetical protein